jgi:hypothetical protein
MKTMLKSKLKEGETVGGEGVAPRRGTVDQLRRTRPLPGQHSRRGLTKADATPPGVAPWNGPSGG